MNQQRNEPDWYTFFWDNLPNVEANQAQDLAMVALEPFTSSPIVQLLIVSLDRAELDVSRGVYNSDFGPGESSGWAEARSKDAEKAFIAMEEVGLVSHTNSGPTHKRSDTYDINLDLILTPTPEVLQLFTSQVKPRIPEFMDSAIRAARERVALRAKYAALEPTETMEAFRVAVEQEALECKATITKMHVKFEVSKAEKVRRKAEREVQKAQRELRKAEKAEKAVKAKLEQLEQFVIVKADPVEIIEVKNATHH